MARSFAIVSAILLLSPEAALAQGNTPRVVVLEVLYSGELPEPIRQRVHTQLVSAIREQGVEVVDPELVALALAPLGPSLASSCRAGQCVRWILDGLEADGGLVASVSAIENSYTVTLVVLGPDGDELDRVQRRCDICTFEELEAAIVAGIGQLEVSVPRRIRAGRIGVVPSPTDTEVSIDGVEVGRGAMSIPVTAGRHVLEGRREGFRTASREVDVEAEQTTRVELALRPGTDPIPLPPPEPLNPRPWLWSTLGAGLAIALAGGVLMSLGENCIDHDAAGACQREWDHRPLGSAMLAGGLGAALVGAVTLTILSLQRQPTSQ